MDACVVDAAQALIKYVARNVRVNRIIALFRR